MSRNNHNYKAAMRFVLFLGVVSLFADITYEGARSIAGPYLALLGASGTIVGFTAGAGELLGYGLRFFFGLLSDKTRRYWALAIAGYGINLLAVPLLALTHHWESAIILLMTERIGKAVRSPAKDVLLSHAAAAVGRGWGFAVHEAMDQIGAMTGPLMVMLVLAIRDSYRYAFAVLAIPALLAILVLLLARMLYPHTQHFEENAERFPKNNVRKLPSRYWMYLGSVCLMAAGYADYPLVAFHIKSHAVFPDQWIPFFYSCAMGVDALSALVFGRWYDKKGLTALRAAIAVSSPFAVFAFSMVPMGIVAGIVLWGVGLGAQESIVRSVVAEMVPQHKRGAGFGLFNACFGAAWFLGSAVMGILYDISLPALMILSMVCQAGSLLLLHKTPASKAL